MTRILRRSVAAGAVAAIAAFGSAGVALAATGSGSGSASPTASGETWQQVHDKVAGALSDRQATLAKLTASVASNKYLTSTDRQALQALLGPETQGINQLAGEVAAATPQNTTIAQLRQDAFTMVHQYRVYLVMAPEVHLSEGADTQTDVELRLSGLEPKLQAAITGAGSPSDAVQAYKDLLTQVGNATGATGKADIPAVLQVTPAGFPADGAPLTTARTSLQTAQNDLRSARSDLQIIRNAIQQGKASNHPGTTSSSAAAGA
jgi:hypothetical protein